MRLEGSTQDPGDSGEPPLEIAVHHLAAAQRDKGQTRLRNPLGIEAVPGPDHQDLVSPRDNGFGQRQRRGDVAAGSAAGDRPLHRRLRLPLEFERFAAECDQSLRAIPRSTPAAARHTTREVRP